ncbi:phosphate propanoyltransferase [Enterococcus sp. PF1-24]|uniref:phosphate propanoyltransferase n=1 Tax=unclassified Enterococcus TaxID=2608891 RepID=UPI0024732CBB|nr:MULTISPECIES: phosphate propanoyltransferase [unclassified Enterococcus]MDH6365451.1 phosphate propanoyltransferase [Enterococcus sp. PFB1-1]MDH6402552.1 phosphate propanoyltransferase [Enterococcus sp. PF1-24]
MVDMNQKALKEIIYQVMSDLELENIPIGISNRHVHLCEEHFRALFPGETIRPMKPLKQPGEFAAEQTVTICGPKGQQERVRLLGPLRKKSQVEISATDARNLGIVAPIRLSGNLTDAAEVTLKTAGREVTFKGCIIAKRHIHMSFNDLEKYQLKATDLVKVRVATPERTTLFEEVALRPGENFVLEMHVDTDEANAANIQLGTIASIVK